MKVKVTEGSHMVIQEQEYKAGDQLDMPDDFAKVQIDAGIVEEVKSTVKSTKGAK